MTTPLTIHKRKRLTTRERIELFRAHNGMCCICGGKIGVGEKWIDEHELALAMGGSNDWENRWSRSPEMRQGQDQGRHGPDSQSKAARGPPFWREKAKAENQIAWLRPIQVKHKATGGRLE